MEGIDLPDGVTVKLINKYNKEHVLKVKEHVKTKDAKIPLAQIIKEWSLREPIIWCENDEKIGMDKKGYSDIAFSFMDEVLIKAEVNGLNQLKAAQDFLNKRQFSNKTIHAHQADTTQYIIEGEIQPELHPNVERKNVLTNIVKASKEATPLEQSVPIAKSVTTSGIKPLVSVSSPSSGIKPLPVTSTSPTVNSPLQRSGSNSGGSGVKRIEIKPITKIESPSSTSLNLNQGLKNVVGDTPMISPRSSGNTGTSASIQIKPKNQGSAPSQELDLYSQLEQLAGLRDRGILTQEEFEHKKKELLGL
jgi:hypothetical protein